MQPKRRHFKSLSVKDVIENKKFWKAIKPFFEKIKPLTTQF